MESYAYIENLKALIKEGKVSEKTLDESVKRVLKVKYELGLFDNPYKYCNDSIERVTLGKAEFQKGVLAMAKKSIVLLKNEKNILPLKKTNQKIALIGALASDKTSPLGSWRIAADENSAVSVLEGMKNYPNNELKYAKGADVTTGRTEFMWETPINNTDTSGFSEAIENAKKQML